MNHQFVSTITKLLNTVVHASLGKHRSSAQETRNKRITRLTHINKDETKPQMINSKFTSIIHHNSTRRPILRKLTTVVFCQPIMMFRPALLKFLGLVAMLPLCGGHRPATTLPSCDSDYGSSSAAFGPWSCSAASSLPVANVPSTLAARRRANRRVTDCKLGGIVIWHSVHSQRE